MASQVWFDPSDGLFKAWIGGILTVIPVGSNSLSNRNNQPILLEDNDEQFEPILPVQLSLDQVAFLNRENVFTLENQFPSIRFGPATAGHVRLEHITNELQILLADGSDFADAIARVLTLSNGQIVFPSTQVPSANANTLDDYEEGVWTAAITGSGGTSGQTYNWQQGYYVKIGKEVAVSWDVALTNKGTITGTTRISGLPFTIEDVNRNFPQANMGLWNNLAVGQVHVTGYGERNTQFINLFGATAAATSLTAFTTTEIGNTTQFIGTLVYRATQ